MWRKCALVCPSFVGLPDRNSGFDLSLDLNVWAFPARSGASMLYLVFRAEAVLPRVSFPVMSPASLCVSQLEVTLFAVERKKRGELIAKRAA